MIPFIQFIGVFFLLSMLDISTTLTVISAGGQELNPVMVGIVTNPILFIIIKLSAVILIGWILYRVYLKNAPAAFIGMAGALIITGLACANNLIVISGADLLDEIFSSNFFIAMSVVILIISTYTVLIGTKYRSTVESIEGITGWIIALMLLLFASIYKEAGL